MNKKIKKALYYSIAILLAVWVVFALKKPGYPDQFNPKPLKGNPDAGIRIVEFSDFECPACGSAEPIVASLVAEYKDVVSYEYKHFPLNSIHPYAQLAAEASECANDQDKFWEYHDMLFRNQKALQKKNLKRYAESLGLDTELFNACIESRAKRDIVTIDLEEGISKGILGTPSIFINGQKIESWAYDSFKEEIESRLG